MQNDSERLRIGTIYENSISAAMYLINDERFTLINGDSGFYKMLGYSQAEYEQILENSFLNSIFAQDKRKFIELFDDFNDGVRQINIRLINKQAGVVWFNAKIIITGDNYDDKNSNIKSKSSVYFCVLTDITKQKEAENDFETQKRFLELLQSTVEGGTLICFDDKKMSIAYVSNDLISFLGYTREEFDKVTQGSLFNIICEQDKEEVRDTMDAWFISGNYYEVEFKIKKKDGSHVWVMNKGNRIKNENGDNVLVSLISDINNTRLIIAKLEAANKDLRSMQNSIPGCFGKMALKEEGFEVISVNQQLQDLFEEYQSDVTKTRLMKYSSLSINEMLINEIALRQEMSIELEIVNDGRWFILRGTFENELYENKYPVYYLMFTDITVQKENQMQAEMQKEKYQKITEITDDIIFEYDCVADIMVYSEKYRQILDKPTIIFNFRNNLMYEKDEIGFVDFTQAFASIFSGQAFFRAEHEVKINDDKSMWLELSAKGIKNESGDTVKIIGILRDIDKQKREQILLYDKSRIDLLSGLYNKISTQEEIVKQIERTNAGAYSALLMIDIDDFKSINDTFGHKVGDEVIQKIANYLSLEFSHDIIGRVGGDEFQIFMSNVFDENMINEKASKICEGIRELFVDNKVDVTVSVGVYYSNRRVSYDNIYQKADIALYNAKANGKDHYEIYGHSIERNDKKQLCVSEENHEIIDAQFFANVVQLLSNEDEIGDKIYTALSMIAHELEVDRIIIQSIDYKAETFSLIYEWYSEGLSSLRGIIQDISLSKYAFFNENPDDIKAFYADDNDCYNKHQKLFFEMNGYKGIVQIPIKIKDITFACVEYITLNENRIFTTAEINAIKCITMVISNYLHTGISRKRFVSSLSKLLSINDNKCESFIKINANDYSYYRFILCNGRIELVERGFDYFNSRFLSEASFIIDEEIQKEFLNKFSKESMDALRRTRSEDIISLEYEHETIGKRGVNKRVAVLLSEKYDIEDYYLIVNYNITDIRQKELDNKQNDLDELKKILSAEYIFDNIMEVDVETEKIRLLHSKQNNILSLLQYDEPYSKIVNYMIDEFVYEEDKESLIEMLDLNKIKKYFNESSEPIMMYVRVMRDGEIKWLCLNIIDVTKSIGKQTYIALLRSDQDYNSQMDINSRLLTINHELEINEVLIRNKTRFDNLTGIYNIEEFTKCCQKLFVTEQEYKLALVRMDIDKFKLINDLYGYEIGDEILKHTANVIRDNIINQGLYGRMNSDIFCMCVRYKNIDEVIGMIDRIIAGLESYDAKYRISSYYGICVIEDRTVDVGVICDWANIALKKIKGSTLNRYAFYDNNMRMNLLDERKFESQMEYALASGQFEAYLQPQYDIRTSKINGAEALIRWNHPVEGIISPARFIPLFERNGFITKVDNFIWREACKILRRWIDDGYKPVPISVNVSRLHMFDDNLCDKIIALLNEYNLPRHLLVLEVTETVMYDDSESMNRMLNKMRNMGFQIAMDDFGSGYSSLNMLENMCLDELKIDRAFLSRASNTENGKIIVKFIISLAKQLNLKIVAEGVENEEQAAMLLEFGCYNAQGYFYSRPVPINRFESQAFDMNNQKEIPLSIKKILAKKGIE